MKKIGVSIWNVVNIAVALMLATAPVAWAVPTAAPAPLIGAGIPLAISIAGGYLGYRAFRRKGS